jgi:glycosyltransferase involved in cell wall biosynthesis
MIGPDEDGVVIDDENVFYLGAVDKEVVLGALASCRAAISMSNSESFGLILVEAWMSKKPVLASSANIAFRELIADREDGYLVHDETDLRQRMVAVLSNEKLASEMGEKGYIKAKDQYTWTSLGGQYAELFNELIH